MGAPPAPLGFAGFDGVPAGGGVQAGGDGALVRLTGAGVEGRLAPTDLVLHTGDRLLVQGPNGAGKSTLLCVLAGELRPDRGVVERRGGAVVGRLAQDDDWPNLCVSARAAYRARMRDADRAPTLRDLGLLRDEDAARPPGELSPGQRRGVALAVLATHDRWIRRRWSGRVLSVPLTAA